LTLEAFHGPYSLAGQKNNTKREARQLSEERMFVSVTVNALPKFYFANSVIVCRRNRDQEDV